jgi:hypothetical protein
MGRAENQRDSGGGTLITTESRLGKVHLARRNLVDAGLSDLVELGVGAARQTLRVLAEPVDVLFLDGRNDLYADVLKLVEPRLRGSALVAADPSADDPDLPSYLRYVRTASNGYLSLEVPLGSGVEVSVRKVARHDRLLLRSEGLGRPAPAEAAPPPVPSGDQRPSDGAVGIHCARSSPSLTRSTTTTASSHPADSRERTMGCDPTAKAEQLTCTRRRARGQPGHSAAGSITNQLQRDFGAINQRNNCHICRRSS